MQITYFFRKSSPSFHSIEKLFSAVIENMPAESVQLHYSPYQSKGIVKRIKIALDALKFQGDINHITGDIHFIALLLPKKKTILTIHDIGIIKKGNFLKRFLLRQIWFVWPIRQVKLLTVISEFTKNELIHFLGVRAEKIVVIPNCIADIYQYTQKTEASKKPVILQIGTKTNKNLERLAAALENIECKLLIVGKLSEQQMMLLKQNKIDYENHFNIPEEEMHSLFIQCDMLAYVSTYEGFGMPVIEANAIGRPVLASDIEPVNRVAANAALLVNPYNIDEIREGIKKILSDKKLASDLVANGLENVKQYRSAEIAKKYRNVYQQITDAK